MHVYVHASTTTARLGDTIDYTVYAYGDGVTALQFELRLPEGLSFVSGSGAVPSGLKSYLGWAATDWTESAMMWTGYNDLPSSFEKGTVILTFSCTAVAAGTYEVELFELLPFNEDYEEFNPTLIVDVLTIDGEHDYTGYVYNNDATCTEDGTETATCLICGKTITRVVVGSALGE